MSLSVDDPSDGAVADELTTKLGARRGVDTRKEA